METITIHSLYAQFQDLFLGVISIKLEESPLKSVQTEMAYIKPKDQYQMADIW